MSSLGYARPDAPRRLLVAVLSACALMLFGASAAGAAATSGTDLGAPNYTGYCQHLGFEQATISNAAYVCLHTDKSTSPIELQAACEFSFAQRPIAEENAFPGIIYTQHCYQTSSGGGPGSGPTPGVTAAQISAALQRGLLPGGAAARIAALLRKGGYPERFAAPAAGSLALYWYLVPKGAHVARGVPTATLIASGTASFTAAGSAHVLIRLTLRGRQLLRRSRSLKLTAKGVYAANGIAAVTRIATFTLKR